MIELSGLARQAASVAAWSGALAELDGVGATEADCIDAISELERLKAAAAAAQGLSHRRDRAGPP